MKDRTVWIFAGLTGLVLIFFINTTPLAHSGIGIKLPFGWQKSNKNYCQEAKMATSLSDCSLTCSSDDTKPQGLPFFTSRISGSNPCDWEHNIYTEVMDALVGIALGTAYVYFAEKNSQKQHTAKK